MVLGDVVCLIEECRHGTRAAKGLRAKGLANRVIFVASELSFVPELKIGTRSSNGFYWRRI
jgi:hypothetical protein